MSATPDVLRKYGYGIEAHGFPDVNGVAPEDSGEEDVIITGYLEGWYPQNVFMSLHHLLDESAKVIVSMNTKISELDRIKYGMFENTVQRLGPSIEEIHASGHSYRDELADVIEQLSPRLTVPVHTLGAPVKEVRALHGTVRFPVPRRIKF